MKKRNKIMTFKKFLSFFYINESLKEIRLNQILDKISQKSKLTQTEEEFLANFDTISDEDLKDLKLLSKDTVFQKVTRLLDLGKKVICNLKDRDGVIGTYITSIITDYEFNNITIILKNKEKITLKDNLLYNIIYNSKKDEFSLEVEDEFYEKLPIRK